MTNPDAFNVLAAANLVVGSGSGSKGMTIYSGTSGEGNIVFADGTTGSQQYRGVLRYDHSDDSMRFYVNGGTESIRIKSDGSVGIGITAPTAILDVVSANQIVNTSTGNFNLRVSDAFAADTVAC